ncbi:hypothetical protein LTR16_003607 [Cryomyces antarcticus]|uniref:Anaphase-promoting complex subunit 4 WD40 domain-containing protein n=1 Tax=Cryomyces antarcticus TaxID=329879 RepID=A0ABR0M6Y4_9PEZI|nr:hypothetical protein LTR16_003607 [Cryomyces antarcticus]
MYTMRTDPSLRRHLRNEDQLGMEQPSYSPAPKCIAATGEAHDSERDACSAAEAIASRKTSTDYRSAQWSPDGTCLITSSADDTLRTFALPHDLLTSREPHILRPYAASPSPEPVCSTAVYPYYDLQNVSSTLVLSSPRNLPIRLQNALLPQAGLTASYSLISPTTEAYITPHSLAFISSGTHFVTGSDSLLAVFDVSRNGQGPIERYPTIPSKRKKAVGGGVGMKGILSCLSISSEGTLAAGTFSRWIGLYDSEGRGSCNAVFSVAEPSEVPGNAENAGGAGVSQVLWSPCGKYLYVAERKSDVVLVYDIRVGGKRLGWLKGRKATTHQRLGIDVVQTARGHEIWGGGTDGMVRVWSNPNEREGEQEAAFEWQAHEARTRAAPREAPLANRDATRVGCGKPSAGGAGLRWHANERPKRGLEQGEVALLFVR